MKNYRVTFKDKIGTTFSGPSSIHVKATSESEAREIAKSRSAGREREIIKVEAI